MRVFTKVNDKLACWDVPGCDYETAIGLVRDELGVGHKPVILALVKY